MSTITTVAPSVSSLRTVSANAPVATVELDLGVHAEGRAHQAFEVGVAALCHDARLDRLLGWSRANIRMLSMSHFEAGATHRRVAAPTRCAVLASGVTLLVR